VMPVGVYLMARSVPLLENAANTRLTMVMVGGLTALLAAVAATTSTNLKQAFSDTTASQMGLMFLGLGTGTGAGISGAIFLLMIHMLLKTSLFLMTDDIAIANNGSSEFRDLAGLRKAMPSHFWLFLLGTILLASGFWGQNTVIGAVWNASITPTTSEALMRTPFGATPPHILAIWFWAATLSLPLTALAMSRALFLSFFHSKERPAIAEPGQAQKWQIGLLLGASFGGGLGLAAVGTSSLFSQFLGRTWSGARYSFTSTTFQSGFGILLVLLAVILAWMMYSKISTWPARFSRVLAPFDRLSRNRFYLDDYGFLLVVLPIRGLAHVFRFCDRFLVDGLLAGGPKETVISIKEFLIPMQNGLVQFYAMSLLFSVAVLLVVLTWLGN